MKQRTRFLYVALLFAVATPAAANDLLRQRDAELQAQRQQDLDVVLPAQIKEVAQCHGTAQTSDLEDQMVDWTGSALEVLSGVDGIFTVKNMAGKWRARRRASRTLASVARTAAEVAGQAALDGARVAVGAAGLGRSVVGLGVPVVASLTFNELFRNQRMPHLWDARALIDNPDFFFSLPEKDMYWYAGNPENEAQSSVLRGLISREVQRCKNFEASQPSAPGTSASRAKPTSAYLPALPSKPDEVFTPAYNAFISGSGLL